MTSSATLQAVCPSTNRGVDSFRHDISIPIGWFVSSLFVFGVGTFLIRAYIKVWLKLLGCYALILCIGIGVMYALGKSDAEYYASFRSGSVISNMTTEKSTSYSDNRDGKVASMLGTYEYIQPNNGSHDESVKFIINEDRTVRAIAKRNGMEKIYYGSWIDLGGYDGEPVKIDMTFTDTQTYVPSYGNHGGGYVTELVAWKSWGEYIELTYAALCEGYIYKDLATAKAKNPEKRVQVTKISN